MTNRQKNGPMTGVLGRSYSLWGISVDPQDAIFNSVVRREFFILIYDDHY